MTIPHSLPYIKYITLSKMINQVLKTKWIASGKQTEKFKELLCQTLEKKYVELFSSGTASFYEILLSLELKPKDEVLIPSYICPSIKKAILKLGLIPTYYDNDRQKIWITSYEQVAKKISPNTKAILINHTFGIQYEKEEIEKIKSLGIFMIEDCAHFIPIEKEDKNISNLFDISFFSFNATKLITTGEGGAIATNNKNIFEKIKNNKLDNGISDINATIGIYQLKNLRKFIQKRKMIAEFYFKELEELTREIKKLKSIYFRFPIIVNNIQDFLNCTNIIFRRGVDTLLHLQNNTNISLPNVEYAYNKTICLPIYPSLTIQQQKLIVKKVKEILNKK